MGEIYFLQGEKMLLVDKTIEEFGYDPTTLSKGSDKIVLFTCDYCGEEVNQKNRIRNNAHKSLPKDACKPCGPKKRNESLMAKYGTKCTLQLDDVKEKRKKTWQDKYGVDHPFANNSVQKKIKKTNKERYGYENAFKNKDIQEKVKKTNLERYGYKNVFEDKRVQAQIREKQIQNGTIKLHDGKHIKELAEECGVAYSTFCERVQKYGFEIAMQMDKTVSALELKLEDYFKNNYIPYQTQVRVDERIADFVLEDKVIVECDGLYYHSELMRIDNDYHEKKRITYLANGYRPFFFRSDEIYNKFDIVCSIINNAIGRSTNVYARKTSFEKVSKEDAKNFLEENHLMGKGQGEPYALIDNGEIMAIMQVRRIKDNHYDISRFCNRLDFSVIGGFSKLLKNVERQLDMDSLTNFTDLRYGMGSHLLDLGFEFVSSNLSFRWTNGKQTFHRMKFPGKEGYEQGLLRIWDCGQAKFLKTY